MQRFICESQYKQRQLASVSLLSCCAVSEGAVRESGVRSFDILPRTHQRAHTHLTLPAHHSSHWGGRNAFFRVTSVNRKRYYLNGSQWARHMPTQQFNVDVWSAQQTLRRKWKGRDWRVVEMPYDKAPRVLRRVIPELYTELPVMADPQRGDYSNVRAKSFPIEEIQEEVLGAQQFPKPVKRGNSNVTLDSFFSTPAAAGAPR